MITQKISILTTEGNTLKSEVYYPSHSNRTTILLASALGIEKSFYKDFAHYLSEKGFLVYTFDYNGVGESHLKSIDKNKSSLKKWGSIDLDTMIKFVYDENPKHELVFIGHNLSGQLISLAKNYQLISKLIFIGSYLPGLKNNSIKNKLQLLFIWQIFIPLITKILGYFPGSKLGWSSDLPMGVILELRKWTLSGNGLFEYYTETINKHIESPIINFSFSGDLVSKSSVNKLLKKFSKAKIEWNHFDSKSLKGKSYGHFDFFKLKYKELFWPSLVQKINEENKTKSIHVSA